MHSIQVRARRADGGRDASHAQGKPVARRGRKARDLSQTARLPVIVGPRTDARPPFAPRRSPSHAICHPSHPTPARRHGGRRRRARRRSRHRARRGRDRGSTVCVTPKFSQIFLPWKDSALYTLSPGGSFETGARRLGAERRRQASSAGNEPFFVGGAGHRSSLSVPAGGARGQRADVHRPHVSVVPVLRPQRGRDARRDLQVEVLWQESGRTRTSMAQLDKKAGAPGRRSSRCRLPSGALSTGRLEPVTFRFTAVGAGGAWQIDDLYVDPYMRR